MDINFRCYGFWKSCSFLGIYLVYRFEEGLVEELIVEIVKNTRNIRCVEIRC